MNGALEDTDDTPSGILMHGIIHESTADVYVRP
jgi:hypothetical protein